MPIAIKNSIIDISLEETTREFAIDFYNYLTGGEVIFLYGEIGVRLVGSEMCIRDRFY